MTTTNPPSTSTALPAPATQLSIRPSDAMATSVASFSQPVADFLGSLNLPTEGVLVPLDERSYVIQSLEGAISVLPYDALTKAAYLSKFVVAVSAGLFDSALNYLWNETISALRRLVASTDLAYFFDIAEKRPEYRKKLTTVDDLQAIQDADLIDVCARIGLLTDVNRERLRHVNYMRNHASAAHPNHNELSGPEMMAWLSNCLRYAIMAKPDTSVLQTQRFLITVREEALHPADVPVLAKEIQKMPQDRIDDLLWTLFGIYTGEKSSATCRTNIEQVAPHVWHVATETRRYEVGGRHAEFLKRNEQARKQFALEFLKHVGGERYRSDDVLAAELLEKLRALHVAHQGFNNFYNEWPHAEGLEVSLPKNGVVPQMVLYTWVFTITQCFIGNGMGYRSGTDEKAVPYYQKFIDSFTEREIAEFLRMFAVEDFTVDLVLSKAEMRAKLLAKQLEERCTNVFIKQGLAQIQNAPPETLRKLASTATYKAILANLPAPK